MRLCSIIENLIALLKRTHINFLELRIFLTLSGYKFFTTLDLAMDYHQVEVRPEDREKTAFNTPYGLLQYNVMPFGIATAPATFMRLIKIIFS